MAISPVDIKWIAFCFKSHTVTWRRSSSGHGSLYALHLVLPPSSLQGRQEGKEVREADVFYIIVNCVIFTRGNIIIITGLLTG
jgi:hypothetical protein